MADEIKNLAKFNVVGWKINTDESVKYDMERLEKCRAQLEKLSKFDPEALLIETFSDSQLVSIFNLKHRRGHIIKWRNSRDVVLYVKEAMETEATEKTPSRPVITWTFQKTYKTKYAQMKIYTMSIKRFIELYKQGDFHDIEPFRFEQIYFRQHVSDAIESLQYKINALEERYNKLYDKKQAELNNEYWNSLNKFEKLEQEAPSKKRVKKDLSVEDVNNLYKGLDKNYWNSKLSETELATLMGWVSRNIYSIRIYALSGGQSGNALKAEYGDMPGLRIREPKYNDNNERTSQDSIGGYVYFKSIENAPIEIFEKIASNGRKFTLGGGTVPNRFADKNFALFLIAEYAKYGFVPGKRNLFKFLDLAELQQSLGEYSEAFNGSYLSI